MSNFRITSGFDGDHGKARRFFSHGDAVADAGRFEYAIEMYIQGLTLDPENLEEHKALRKLSIKRMKAGGKVMGMFERRKYPTDAKDRKQNMLGAERLLAFDPTNVDLMTVFQNCATRAENELVARWVVDVLLRAARDPDSTTED